MFSLKYHKKTSTPALIGNGILNVFLLQKINKCIPPFTLLFFHTICGGKQSSPKSAHSEDVIERTAVASVSDALFHYTRGTVCS